MSKNTGGPAFPQPTGEMYCAVEKHPDFGGMTLRDYFAAAGMPNDGSHPHDPDDLNRCLLLLEAVPEIREHMDRVAGINGTWAKLAARWDEVEQSFLDEVGRNWSKGRSAPRTYKLMKAIGC